MLKYTFKKCNFGNSRYYEVKRGKYYPSVTQILGTTKSAKMKAILNNWRKSNSDAAKKYPHDGTVFHSIIEDFLLQVSNFMELTESISQLGNLRVEQFWEKGYDVLQNIANQYEIQLIEGGVWHRSKFAGTIDCLAQCKETKQSILFDWKTSSRRRSKEEIEDYLLQIAAYQKAILCTYGLQVYHAEIVIFLCEDEPQIIRLDQRELDYYWGLFCDRRDSYFEKYPLIDPAALSLGFVS